MNISKFAFALVAGLCLVTPQKSYATVYADALTAAGPCSPVVLLLCPSGVDNPQNAVDANPSNYALMTTAVGLGSSAYLEVSFPVAAPAGSVISFVIQPENNVLNLNLLQSYTVELFDSNGTLVGAYNNFNLANVDLLSGNGQRYLLNTYSTVGSYHIKRARLTTGGLLQLLNTTRVFSAFYNVSCPPIYANTLISQSTNLPLCLTGCVNDAANVTDSNYTTNYATFNTVISLSNMHITVGFPVAADSNDFIGFTLENAPTLLTLNLLSNLSADFMDNSNNVLFSISDFGLANVFLIDPGLQTYGLGMKVPSNVTTPITRARIQFSGVSVLYSIKIYNAFHYKLRPPLAVIAASSPVVCHNSAVTLTSAAPGSVAWQWQPGGGTTDHITVSQPGTYILTVTDIDGCRNSDTITLIQNSPLLNNTDSTGTPGCYGQNGGYASISTTGGTPNYQYSWSHNPGLNSTMATSLTAGNYSVIVTDADGCTDTTHIVISQPDSLVAVNIVSANPLCHGLATGSATVHTTGGTPGYTYSWDHTGALNDSVANLLSAGTYIVTVTDINGCSDTAIFTITHPDSLIAVSSLAQQPLCNGGSNGTAIVHTTGGTGSYQYSWSHNNLLNDSIAGSLATGSYTVIVTDINGCSDSAMFTISQPGLLEPNALTGNLLCNNDASGTLDIIPSGGMHWINCELNGNMVGIGIQPGDTLSFGNLPAGNYTVILSDSNGCQTTNNYILTEPAVLSASLSGYTDADCNVANGTATITTNGGTQNYTHHWSHDNGLSGNTATNIPTGATTVIIRDANNCTDTVSFAVGSINAPDATITATDAFCMNENSGSATISQITGNGGYTYVWYDNNQNPIGQTSSAAGNLAAGTYIVQITDQNGCIVYDTTTIGQPATSVEVMITSLITPACFGEDGLVTAAGGNGTGNISYTWMPGNVTGATLTAVAGTYTVTATDENGCSTSETVVITQPDAITIQGNTVPVSCYGGDNGAAAAMVSGGTGSYSYLWTGVSASGTSVSGLTSGTYDVQVTDSNGCTQSLSIIITEPEALNVALLDTVTPFCGTTDGIIDIEVSGGTGSYTYLWSTGAVTQNLTNVGEGVYQVIVMDENLCMDSLSVTLDCEVPFIVPGVITPNGNGQNDVWYISGLDKFPDAGVEIFNRWGNTVFSERPYQNNWGGMSNGIGTIGNGVLPSGTYFFVLDLGVNKQKITGYLELQQ